MSQKVKRLQSWMLEMDGKYAIMSDARADKVITETAEHFYQLAEKDTVERVVKWLEDNGIGYNNSESDFDHGDPAELIQDLKKAMEE